MTEIEESAALWQYMKENYPGHVEVFYDKNKYEEARKVRRRAGISHYSDDMMSRIVMEDANAVAKAIETGHRRQQGVKNLRDTIRHKFGAENCQDEGHYGIWVISGDRKGFAKWGWNDWWIATYHNGDRKTCEWTKDFDKVISIIDEQVVNIQ